MFHRSRVTSTAVRMPPVWAFVCNISWFSGIWFRIDFWLYQKSGTSVLTKDDTIAGSPAVRDLSSVTETCEWLQLYVLLDAWSRACSYPSGVVVRRVGNWLFLCTLWRGLHIPHPPHSCSLKFSHEHHSTWTAVRGRVHDLSARHVRIFFSWRILKQIFRASLGSGIVVYTPPWYVLDMKVCCTSALIWRSHLRAHWSFSLLLRAHNPIARRIFETSMPRSSTTLRAIVTFLMCSSSIPWRASSGSTTTRRILTCSEAALP